jgi:hypothetical protein
MNGVWKSKFNALGGSATNWEEAGGSGSNFKLAEGLQSNHLPATYPHRHQGTGWAPAQSWMASASTARASCTNDHRVADTTCAGHSSVEFSSSS